MQLAPGHRKLTLSFYSPCGKTEKQVATVGEHPGALYATATRVGGEALIFGGRARGPQAGTAAVTLVGPEGARPGPEGPPRARF